MYNVCTGTCIFFVVCMLLKSSPPSSSLGWPAGEPSSSSSSSSQQQQQQQLSRLQLWRLLRDCNIHHLTPSIFDTDPVTTATATTSQGGSDSEEPVAACHQPWRPFLMRDFLQALTLLSHHLYHHSSGGTETVRWGIGCFLAVFTRMLTGYCKIFTELCSTASCTCTVRLHIQYIYPVK